MPGEARCGVALQSKDGFVNIAKIVPDSPAAAVVHKGQTVVAVNGERVNGDAALAQRLIVCAIQAQSCTTGRLLPVRLTVGTLQLDSPKGIEADFLDISDPIAEGPKPEHDKRQPPLGVGEVVQCL